MIWRTSGIVALQQELVFQLGGMTYKIWLAYRAQLRLPMRGRSTPRRFCSDKLSRPYHNRRGGVFIPWSYARNP